MGFWSRHAIDCTYNVCQKSNWTPALVTFPRKVRGHLPLHPAARLGPRSRARMSCRLPKRTAGVLRRPAFKLGDRHQTLTSPPNQAQFRRDVLIEEVRADIDSRRCLRWRERDPWNRGCELPSHAVPLSLLHMPGVVPHHRQDASLDSSDTRLLELTTDLPPRPASLSSPSVPLGRPFSSRPVPAPNPPLLLPLSLCLLTYLCNQWTLTPPRRPQPLRLVGLPDCAADHVHITSCVCVVSCGQRALLALRGESS